MKKFLSFLLVLSLCLSSAILLASCSGKSAYEVAVENGFVGDEKAWLESLKGPAGDKGNDGKPGSAGIDAYDGLPGDDGLSAYEDAKLNHGYLKTVQDWLASLRGQDARDGHTAVITVDSNGYWVVDGTRQPVKVDGSKAAVVSLELVQNVFSVVKSGMTAPQLEIKVKFDDGSESVLPVSNSVVAETSYDLTTEGVYNVKISYGGIVRDDTITVDGLMVYFNNFDTLSNDATMAEICAEAGIQIPIHAIDSTYSVNVTIDGEKVKMTLAEAYAQGIPTWAFDGSDITPYLMHGQLHSQNFSELHIVNGKLSFKDMGNNGYMDSLTSSMILFANDEEMALAATDTYTIQFDISMPRMTDNGTPNDTSDDAFTTAINPSVVKQTILFCAKYSIEKSNSKPTAVGPGFAKQYIMANVFLADKWNLGTGRLNDTTIEGVEAANSMNIFNALFPTESSGHWYGNEVTVRIVVRAKTSENPGYTVYIKKVDEADDKFVRVGEFNSKTVTEAGMERFMMEGNNGFGISSRYGQGYSACLLDNVAAWTGDGNMPMNKNTSTYEDLNAQYNEANANPVA